ncbi:MAG: thioredoxin family protein, partial [Candidatus Pacebacteria bacterium]|nr:thioredoxin family protein [Candidatus Paceibacterota bacterium]
MRTKTILLLLVALFAAYAVQAQQKDSIHFIEDTPYDSLLAKAKQEGKPLFLDCYTSWCGPCKWMDTHMFTVDSVTHFYNTHFVCARIDMEKEGEGSTLKKQLEVKAYPTYFLIGWDGKPIDRVSGAFIKNGEPLTKEFIMFGKRAFDERESTFYLLSDKYENSSISQQELVEYMERRSMMLMSTNSEVDTFFTRQSDPTDSLSWHVIKRYAGEKSNAFRYLVSNRDIFNSRYTPDSVNGVIELKYARAMFEAFRATDSLGNRYIDSVEYLRLRTTVIALGADFSDKLVLKMDLIYYQMKEDWNQYIATAKKDISAYWNDALLLNQISWYFYEHASAPADIAQAV